MQQLQSWKRWLPCALVLVCAAWPALARDDGADGKFSKRTSSHFVLYQDVDIDQSHGLRGSRRFEQDVLDTLEGAYDKLDVYLGLRPRRPITVVVYDPVIFDQTYAGLFRFAAAGFYAGIVRIRGDTRVHQNLVRVLHHELVHAALDAEAPSLSVPAWLNEGLAEWFEARSTGKRLLSPGQAHRLSSFARQGVLFSLTQLSVPSFSRFSADAAQVAYLQSYAFVTYLVRQHGERSLRDLCEGYLRSHDLARAVQRTYRSELSQLDERFRSDAARGV